MELLAAAADAVGAPLNEQQLARFKQYFELLEEGSKRANLIGAHGWERIRDELFIRSLRLLAPAPGGHLSTAQWMNERKVIDVGTGAGIPGLVLKIICPGMTLTLLDSNRKKTSFLRESVSSLGLDDVEVITGRAEELANQNQYREKYEVVLSRGVARLSELAELTLPFAVQGGTIIAPKGPNADEEIQEALFAVNKLGGMPPIAQKISKPGTAPGDTIVYILKVRSTPQGYPRRTGLPHQRPLLPPTETG